MAEAQSTNAQGTQSTANTCPAYLYPQFEVAVVSPTTKYYFHTDKVGTFLTRYTVAFQGYRSGGAGDDTGLTVVLSAKIGTADYSQTWTGVLAGETSLTTLELPIVDTILSNADYINIQVTSFYQARAHSVNGLNKYLAIEYGDVIGGFFESAEYTTRCDGNDWIQGYSLYYDDTPTSISVGPSIGAMSSVTVPTYENWSNTTTQSDTWHNAQLFRLASAGSESSAYTINQYTKTSIIATITSGQLDVLVSNNGTDFVTYDSLTADGYIVVTGFSYVKVSVASGVVDSCALTSQRRFSRCAIEPENRRESLRIGRFKSRRGWGRGDG